MGVPFEALIPYAIIVGAFGVTGLGLSTVRYYSNGGKPGRYNIDRWDRQMMQRDQRLTGYKRGQTDKPTAPDGFELNNPWAVEKRYY